MTNEEVPQGSTSDSPDYSTPRANLITDCQAYTSVEGDDTITIEGSGKLVGRDRRPVLRRDVFRLAAIGCKDIEISEWFGIDSNTLRYNFSVELLKGRETLKQSLRRKQLEVAMSGNVVMLIFLGKNLLGQSDSPLNTQDVTVLPWEDA